jgi:hypothetical protein
LKESEEARVKAEDQKLKDDGEKRVRGVGGKKAPVFVRPKQFPGFEVEEGGGPVEGGRPVGPFGVPVLGEEADRVEAAKAEADRVEAAKAEADRVEAAKAEADRVEAAKAEAAKPKTTVEDDEARAAATEVTNTHEEQKRLEWEAQKKREAKALTHRLELSNDQVLEAERVALEKQGQ